MLHEAGLLVFRNRPELVGELLTDRAGVELPPWERAVVMDADLTQVFPAAFHADLAVLLDANGVPVLGIIVEVQLKEDPDRLVSWPVYLSALRAKHRCPCLLVVVATNNRVARWAARAEIDLTGRGDRLRPLVLGPSAIAMEPPPRVRPRSGGCCGPSRVHASRAAPSLWWKR
jgi:hypothetical protein